MSMKTIELENSYATALAVLRQLEFPNNGEEGDSRAIDTAAQTVMDLREALIKFEESGQ